MATIFVRRDGTGFAPFILLDRRTNSPVAMPDNSANFVQAEATEDMKYLTKQGIRLIEQGTYVDVCGKDCSEHHKIRLKTDALEVFANEGPSRIVYWNAKSKKLREAWLSD